MQEIFDKLPPKIQNFVRPDTPAKRKLMVASGMLPLPPQQLIPVLYLLSKDPDPKVSEKATTSFRRQPGNVLTPLLSSPQTSPALLHFIVQQFEDDEMIVQAALMNRTTPDETFVWLAGRIKGVLLELLSQNQERQQRSPAFVQALINNSDLLETSRTRVIEFAIRQGVETGLSEAELKAFNAEDLVLAGPEEIEKEEEIPEWMLEEKPEVKVINRKDFMKKQQEEEAEQLSIEQQIRTWSVSQKIKGAISGNKQVRSLLIRESNKLVSTAVMKNPRITESEVIKIAASRNVSEDVIREITRNREWMKLYQVKSNLTGNPKCPQAVAIRLLPSLRAKDLRDLMRNKNIPSSVSSQARKLFKTKGPGAR